MLHKCEPLLWVVSDDAPDYVFWYPPVRHLGDHILQDVPVSMTTITHLHTAQFSVQTIPIVTPPGYHAYHSVLGTNIL